MSTLTADLLVIGAGSGGLSVAAGASQMGADVILLEGHKMGGDCLNYGCVPSKALLAAAKAAHAHRHTDVFGTPNDAPDADYACAMAHVSEVIARIEPVDSQERFESLGVRVIREFGRFVSPTEVQAGPHRITARRIVIATGSAPLVPPIPGLDTVPYLTNETLFQQHEKPAHLLIVGGGPIGVEMAQAHARLGSAVTVIEGAKALGRDDPELAEVVLDSLRADGVTLAEGMMVSRVEKTAAGLAVHTGDGQEFAGSHLLLAIGRKANTGRLDLAAAGVRITRTGVQVDAGLRTTNRRVYAIGDAAGGLQFTHLAGYHASVIIRSALFGLPARAKTSHIPRVTYTDPELAQVGLTEAQARARHGRALDVARFDFAHNDRAIAERKTRGFIKVMVVKGRPVGASIVGHQAGETINLWALALANNLKMSQLSAMVAPYPTYGELSRRAAGAYFAPRLFDSPRVKKTVRFVQKYLP